MISVNKVITLLILILFAEVYPQTALHQQLEYAKELFNQEKYFDAITELKRLQFFDKEKLFAYQSSMMIGESYKQGTKYDEAVRYFSLAEIYASKSDERFAAKILNARTNILRRTTKQAERILSELLNDKFYEDKQNQINYWLGWNYIFADEWDKAYEIFYKDYLDTTLANICKSVNDNLYSVAFAKYSSYLIPGFGQFYTGEYLSGILSLGWNILGGYLTINSFIEDRVFDGIMVSNFLWMRFYSGNIQNAEKFALQKNLEISNSALLYLQNIGGIKKP